MSKYNALWEYIEKCDSCILELTFDEIERIIGISLDHSFLKYKKELLEYGWKVGKISMKDKTVVFMPIHVTETTGNEECRGGCDREK